MTQQLSYKDLPTCTEQQVFDYVADFLLTQHQQCLSSDGDPVMFNDAGLRCAAGSLVPLNEWPTILQTHPSLNAGTSWGIIVTNTNLPKQHHSLILSLQIIHDNPSGPTFWPEKLRTLAHQFNLSTKVVDRHPTS